ESIRKQYKIKTHNLKVDNSSLITYHKKKYSVPSKYIGKIIDVQQIDNSLYIYCSTNLITIHHISENNINYYEAHYKELMKTTLKFNDNKIKEFNINNLSFVDALLKLTDKGIDDFDFNYQENLNKQDILDLLSHRFIHNFENII
ncbi:Mu transposase domain-containing protein, partial [Streptobacillus canis]|uniref:Mu transposase domain-containing protein n=1 Tax=Streptobacillus canis TaxID=2678686 RepID=UPI0038B536C2